ncbi:GAF domain-containing sensor histidine kinase [Dongia soli]|uniref:histidine kinase n=1 Tax=Dongia soli TaxID=600628 RepID=A0ABU5EH54_9PROT|nr:GAF domain-containing sensor histidine kinase [Dongia soli]MDY0885566.1 GAF domain-containing sensor histidine kinase [Dongia soli]
MLATGDVLARDTSEHARLAALDAYGIVDTAAEEAFDRFVRVAAAILRVPIALISLIDLDRQWLKARIGIDLQETARSIAFCDHTIRQDHVMMVPDAVTDDRFAQNPLVIDAPYIRFYAGAPLITPQGDRLGALCVMDQQPRRLTDEEQDLLRDLAGMVVDSLELRRLKESAARQAKDMALLAQESAQAQAHAERLLQQKSLFIAAMAHELRTPLNAIIGFTDLLRLDVAKEFPEERRREFIDIVNSSGQHLLDLINDLLDLSKIEAGKFEVKPEPTDVSALVTQVHRMMSGLAKDHRQKFDIKIDPKLPAVMADPRALKQILVNLISNAIKFTPHGGYVGVTVAMQNSGCRIFVSDTGRGISADDLKEIAEPYRQIRHNDTDAGPGTGLGLAICRRLVQLHGSVLEIESSPGNGTTVSFSLPFAA